MNIRGPQFNDCQLKAYLAYQRNLFLLALSFFSRLPMKPEVQYSPSKMRRASRFFPLVGLLLGLILAGAYTLLVPLAGIAPSIAIILMASLLLTGALHEDGLADTCDGFWGGYNTQQKLTIMKDSRIGTYGTCALIMTLLTKFVLLSALADQGVLVISLLIGYSLSRAMAITLVQDMPYVSNRVPTTGSKSESLAKPFKQKELLFVLLTGGGLIIFLPFATICYTIIGCWVFRSLLKAWMCKHIGGYTGDCLGAAQQIHELLIYLIILMNISNPLLI